MLSPEEGEKEVRRISMMVIKEVSKHELADAFLIVSNVVANLCVTGYSAFKEVSGKGSTAGNAWMNTVLESISMMAEQNGFEMGLSMTIKDGRQ